MSVWHVAHEELRNAIHSKGLDPTGERAVLLLADMPEPIEGFDVWEVESGEEGAEGAARFCLEPIGPERLRLCLPERSPGM